jgi:hypothetical protein
MSTFRNPVGPQPSSVYWRRRLLVALGALAVIVIIVLIVMPRNSPTASKTNPSSPSPSNSASLSAEPSSCEASAISVEAVTDKGVYQAGELPNLSMTITNIGTTVCTLSAGSDVQVYTITSGSDPIWNSKDCQTDEVAQTAELQPNESISSTAFPWDRTRSSPTTCTGDRPAVIAKGATYQLEVSVGDITSAEKKRFILN